MVKPDINNNKQLVYKMPGIEGGGGGENRTNRDNNYVGIR